jgi:hypothetical protein
MRIEEWLSFHPPKKPDSGNAQRILPTEKVSAISFRSALIGTRCRYGLQEYVSPAAVAMVSPTDDARLQQAKKTPPEMGRVAGLRFLYRLAMESLRQLISAEQHPANASFFRVARAVLRRRAQSRPNLNPQLALDFQGFLVGTRRLELLTSTASR